MISRIIIKSQISVFSQIQKCRIALKRGEISSEMREERKYEVSGNNLTLIFL